MNFGTYCQFFLLSFNRKPFWMPKGSNNKSYELSCQNAGSLNGHNLKKKLSSNLIPSFNNNRTFLKVLFWSKDCWNGNKAKQVGENPSIFIILVLVFKKNLNEVLVISFEERNKNVGALLRFGRKMLFNYWENEETQYFKTEF